MPFSDSPPALVIPDTPEWRRRAEVEILPELYGPGALKSSHAYCDRFAKRDSHDTQATLVLSKTWPDCYSCLNRDPSGERNHSWCYRCYAGLMHVQMHVYDAERDRDRAVRL